ncbi:MAG: hypothetical protein KF752_20765 [Pirellulaceae bacterium]|nr:hypothetical protein [Pirellulaceae bacterium]
MRPLLATSFLLVSCFEFNNVSTAADFLLADQAAWPGQILAIRGDRLEPIWQRGQSSDERLVSKIQSLTPAPDGGLIFCSGLDRSVMQWNNGGESELHYGGSVVRQVRTDTNGDVYWSGLETPLDSNPLPDGYIHRRHHATGQVETLLTFSQELVEKDWWGAFDVRQGIVYVATLRAPSKLYRIENSIPKLLVTLPIPVSAFRLGSSNSVLASDGVGKLYRFADLSRPEEFEVIWSGRQPIVDFTPQPQAAKF